MATIQETEPTSSKEFTQALTAWKEVINDPDTYLGSYAGAGIVFTAEGDGAKFFGDEESPVWSQLREAAKEGKVNIAGIEFNLTSLELMGGFYRDLGLIGHCVDERLDEQHQFANSGTHVDCGAANAVGSVIGVKGSEVEDMIQAKFGYEGKQGLLSGTEAQHYSLVVYVDTSSQARGVKPELKTQMQQENALSFHASLSLSKVKEYLAKTGQEAKTAELVEALYKWNIQIPFNIITGHHNAFHEAALKDGIVLVVDKRDADSQTEEMSLLEAHLAQAQAALKLTRMDIN